MSGNKCAYYKCGKSQRNHPLLSFFIFPKTLRLFNIWKDLCGNSLKDVTNPVLCSDHFADKMFTDDVKPRLIHNAKPEPWNQSKLKISNGNGADSDDDSDDSAEIPLARLIVRSQPEPETVGVKTDDSELPTNWIVSCQLQSVVPEEEMENIKDLTDEAKENARVEPYYLILFHQEPKLECDTCSNALKVTNFLYTTRGDTLFKCKHCPAYFLQPVELIAHIGGIHQRKWEILCKICRTFHANFDGFSRHFQSHAATTATFHGCGRCEVKGRKRARMSMCIHCKRIFSSQNKLAKHMKLHRGERSHVCSVCDKQFAKLSHLERHVRSHGDEDTRIPCPHCGDVLTGCYERHMEQHHPEKMCKCLFCENIFVDESSLQTHVSLSHVGASISVSEDDFGNDGCSINGDDEEEKFNVVTVKTELNSEDETLKAISEILGRAKLRKRRKRRKFKRLKRLKITQDEDGDAEEKPFTCEHCAKVYVKKDHLRIHMYNHFKPLTCPICGQRFAFRTYLRNHLATHSGEKRFLCHLCGASFTQYGNLQSHLKRHTGKKRFECPYCPKSFFLRGALKKHLRTHTGDKPFVCPFCNKSFSSSGNMARHRMIHTGEKPYKCTYCEKAFIQSTELKNHLRTHTGEPRPRRPIADKKYHCVHCGKMFTSSAYLKSHIRVHTGERPYKCTVCDKTFAKISSFSQHRKIHLTIKPFICNYCGKGFSQSGNFNMHLRRHTGEKPYKCQTCGKCFSQPVNLTRHQSVHTGEKKFICNHCGKKFSQSHALADHINVHTGAKPHKCMYCDSCFANQSTLSRHLSTHSQHTFAPLQRRAPATALPDLPPYFTLVGNQCDVSGDKELYKEPVI